MSRATKELACFIVNSVAGNRIDQAVDQIQDCKTELDMLGIQDLFYKASLQQTPGTARNVLLKEW